MGLGKTVQTIAVLLAQAEMGPSIIDCAHIRLPQLGKRTRPLLAHASVTVSAPATGTGGGLGPGDARRKLRAAAYGSQCFSGASGRWPFSMKRKRSRTPTPAAPGPAARFRQPSAWRSRARPSKTALRIFGACST
ncbi:MAG: hypothetical protein ACLSTO_07535 [Bilophila wadsworthia]